MFAKIMTPVDLRHVDRLEKSLECSAELARHYGASLVYVGVTGAMPGSVAHNPEEYAQKLGAFAAKQGEARGIATSSHAVTAHDPSVDLDGALLKAVGETGADLVVMGTHVPGLSDYIWSSNGGKIAAHADVSVMLVRG